MSNLMTPQAVAKYLSKTAPLLFSHLLEQSGQHEVRSYLPRRIGLCVSGGADSMALAYLLHNMRQPLPTNEQLFAAHAFVVDHGVRFGSRDEAVQVQHNLREMGITSRILTIDWSNYDLKNLLASGFEDTARYHRYRVIVRAALKEDITDIFTGHHFDDQIETLLLRLIRNERTGPLGFQGMMAVNSVPCCHTVFGAQPLSSLVSPPLHSALDGTSKDVLIAERLRNHGVRLHRPLLPFTKRQILSTCKHFQIPFIDDKTNTDPTFTARNAIRHLRTHYSFPKALQDQNLVALQDGARTVLNDLENYSRSLCRLITKFRLHSHTGMLELCFGRISHLPLEVRGGLSYAMSRMFEIVSPVQSETWPTLLDEQVTNKIASILVDSTCKKHEPILAYKTMLRSSIAFDTTGNHNVSLMIFRQPMRSAEIASNTFKFVGRTKLHIDTKRRVEEWKCPWLLWDSRFWIRLSSQEAGMIENITMRPYQPSDVCNTTKTLEEQGQFDNYKKQMFTSAPGNIKFTIPVLIYQQKVVSFPTLKICLVPSEWLQTTVRCARSLRTMTFLRSNSLTLET